LLLVLGRIWDAVIDPVIGGLVDRTNTKWGKFKPWMTAGLVGSVIILVVPFFADLPSSQYITILFPCYFLFALFFSFNDIAYGAMLPALSGEQEGRNLLVSRSVISNNISSSAVDVLCPLFTAGTLAIGGSAVNGYRLIALCCVILFMVFSCFTLFGVKEPRIQVKQEEPMQFRELIRQIRGNDQLLWLSLYRIFTSVGGSVLTLSTVFTLLIYLRFGYNGSLMTVSTVGGGIASAAFIIFFPNLLKKLKRRQVVRVMFFSHLGALAVFAASNLLLPADPWQLQYGILV